MSYSATFQPMLEAVLYPAPQDSVKKVFKPQGNTYALSFFISHKAIDVNRIFELF